MKNLLAGLFAGVLCLAPVTNACAQTAADDAYAQKNYALAEKLYSEQLKSEPNNATFWYRLGVSEQSLRQFAGAAAAYEKALALGYPSSYVHYRVATLQLAQGRISAALTELEAASGLKGLPPTVLRNDPALAALQTNPRFLALVEKQDALFNPCRADASYHALDFWIGDWRVVNKAGPGGGTSHIEAVTNGCAIRESWSGSAGELGQSLTAFDKTSGVWKQRYISSTGSVSDYVGHKAGSSLVFILTLPNGSLVRMTYTPLAGGSVEQLFESSSDNGRSWTTTGDYLYSRAAPQG